MIKKIPTHKESYHYTMTHNRCISVLAHLLNRNLLMCLSVLLIIPLCLCVRSAQYLSPCIYPFCSISLAVSVRSAQYLFLCLPVLLNISLCVCLFCSISLPESVCSAQYISLSVRCDHYLSPCLTPSPIHLHPPELDPSPIRVDVINGWPLIQIKTQPSNYVGIRSYLTVTSVGCEVLD